MIKNNELNKFALIKNDEKDEYIQKALFHKKLIYLYAISLQNIEFI